MASIADLRLLGAQVENPVATATFINGLIITRRQKAGVLRDYLTEVGIDLSDEVRNAASEYLEFF